MRNEREAGLMPDVSIIENTCPVKIGGSGDDRSTVVEDGQFDCITGIPSGRVQNTSEASRIDVETTVGPETFRQSRQVEARAPASRNDLNRSPTAQDRGRTGGCVQVVVSTESAAGARGIAGFTHIDSGLALVPEIPGHE